MKSFWSSQFKNVLLTSTYSSGPQASSSEEIEHLQEVKVTSTSGQQTRTAHVATRISQNAWITVTTVSLYSTFYFHFTASDIKVKG